jgi:hypothetical protein
LVTALEIGPDGLEIKNGDVHLDALLRISNVGRTPALGAHTNMKLITDVENTGELVTRFAAENKVRSPHGLFVSPNDFYYRPWYPSTSDDSEQSERQIISPLLIGCVTYEILQDKEIHQIAFAYQLGKKDGSPWGAIIGGK